MKLFSFFLMQTCSFFDVIAYISVCVCIVTWFTKRTQTARAVSGCGSFLVWDELIVNIWASQIVCGLSGWNVLSWIWMINMFIASPFLLPYSLALLHSLSLSICRSSLKTRWFRRPPKLLKLGAFSFRLSSVPMILLPRVHVCVCLSLPLTCSPPP